MVIGPLGMKDTAFWVPGEKASRLAEVLDSDPFKKSSLRFCRTESEIKMSYLKGGAGMCGTAEDYFKFLQMILNGGEYEGRRYLSKKTVEFMLQNHLVGMGGSTEASTGPGSITSSARSSPFGVDRTLHPNPDSVRLVQPLQPGERIHELRSDQLSRRGRT